MSNLDAIYDYKEDKFTSWNPVFNLIMELKYRYFGYFGRFDYSKSNNIVQYWADELKNAGIPKYADILKYTKVIGYDEFVLLKYNSIAVYNDESGMTLNDLWSMYDGFYRECRGVVIDVRRDELVITPYAKFFNLNELEETSYDTIVKYMTDNNVTTKELEFTEKLDGSLISARWYHGKLVLAGTGSLDPNINPILTWAREYIMSHENYLKLIIEGNSTLFRQDTFMFECICPVKQHVVDYDEMQYGLYLIGVRDTIYNSVCHYDTILHIAKDWDVLTTKIYKDYTLDEVISKMDDSVGSTHEGFVMNIKREDGFRIKIKYSDYVQLALLMNNPSRDIFVKYVYHNELDDIKSLLRTKNKHIILEEIEECEHVIHDYVRTYEMLLDYYNKHVDGMKQQGCDIRDIMKYANSLQPKFIRGDVINVYKNTYDYMNHPCYQLIKPGSRHSDDLGYLPFNTIVERLELLKKILRKNAIIDKLKGGIIHEI